MSSVSDVRGYKASLSTITCHLVTDHNYCHPCYHRWGQLRVLRDYLWQFGGLYAEEPKMNTSFILKEPRAWVCVYNLVECILAGIPGPAPSQGCSLGLFVREFTLRLWEVKYSPQDAGMDRSLVSHEVSSKGEASNERSHRGMRLQLLQQPWARKDL